MNEETAVGPAVDPVEEVVSPLRDRRPMYGAFYGLVEPPFDLTPDPKFLFLTQRQREALGNLHYGLSTSRGFTMLVGDAGTGKTTMVRAALGALSDSFSRYVLISNPTLEKAEFYELLVRGFGLSQAALQSKATFLAELTQNVEERFAQGGLTGIIIDEAQSLPSALLEEIRLLGNIETTNTKLLNIVLAGQPELGARLNEPSLRQLKQRVTLRCELRALTADETAAYIAGRIRIARGTPEEIFSHSAIGAIHRGSRGIPRVINVLCDNALISGFATETKPITAAIVDDVCRDFDLGATPAPMPIESAAPAAAAPAALPALIPAASAATAPIAGPAQEQSIDHPRSRVAPARPPAPSSPQAAGREMFEASKPKPRSRFFSELFGR